ncbi:vacuolar protein sorting-associated protein 53 -like protein [Phanerochaete sordida]|uniref:Vacuolar protein sorting-associated protein 53 -like protein n=1 Tax=Phanerochaete sordida TaxID=48140 RepID=A0A9P3GDE5_9APHY|nr:vacuolar protein sorting-associated protein 53 -like protein [Phanerochaete sordida]
MSTAPLRYPAALTNARREDALPHELIVSIQRVLDLHPGADADPLDDLSDGFSPIGVLNEFFPTEASLSKLETVQTQLVQTEQELQHEISLLQEDLRKEQDPNRMQAIQEMISELLGQMSRIREKATESEAVVRNITKEIQVLDLAKRNLILSMTTMKRLQSLVNALGQLEEQMKENRYAEIAQTLAAVKQITASFKQYNSLHRMNQITRRVHDMQNELRAKIDADWDKFYAQDPAKPVKPSTMAAACRVVDVLGPDVRAAFIERYVALELKEYRRIFKASDEAGQMDNVTNRFGWCRRLLQAHETETGRVFPGDWQVGWHLTAKFIEITRDDMTTLLSKAGSGLSVKLLLDTLQEVLDFEASIVKKFATPLVDILKVTQPITGSRPNKPISAAFEPHMSVFISAQDKALSDMLSKYRGPKSRTSLEASAPEGDDSEPRASVFPSSTELFYFYAQILEQCANLFTGQPLYDLAQLQKKWLKIYAEEVLVASLKRPASFVRRSIETRLDMNELKNACVLINTADYCHQTALELEEKIREKVSDTYKEKISFQEECDLFVSAVSAAILAILKELEGACEPAFTAMSRMSWSTLNLVSGNSPYVDDLIKAIENVVDVVKPMIDQKKYLRNFFDKAAGLLVTKFTNALVRSRPLKEIGAEQLLIDLGIIKAALLRIPGEANITSNYTRTVTKNTQRLEALLKVIVTPVDPPEGFILNYTLLIGDQSFSNFQKILDLKGTPKQQQNDLMDSFLSITSTKTDLESTSFLSSLDMEPAQSSLTSSNLGSPGGSRVNLLAGTGGESILAALTSPPLASGLSGSGSDTPPREAQPTSKFSDFRRFVSFAVRRDSMQHP